MAKDENAAASADGEEGENKGGKKKLIIILLIVLVALSVAGGVTWFLLMGDNGDSEAVAADAELAEPVHGPAIYYKVRQPLIVTFDVEGKQRFLQAHLSLMTRDQAVYDGLELHLPVIQNQLLNVFGKKDFMDIQSHEGRLALQQEALTITNKVLTQENVDGEIESVLFTNLVMQ